MRLFLKNITRPKKAATHIANALGVPLARAQQGVAYGSGYRDWHELERGLTASPPSSVDDDLPIAEFVDRETHLVLSLARSLALPYGDAQYALAECRLMGNRPPTLDDQLTIRLACFRATTLPPAPSRTSGTIGRLKTSGRNGEVVILRSFGRPTEVVTHGSVATVADFEYLSPREQPRLFIPMRLYLPYGSWLEPNGDEVLFSRDYKPLWRIRQNGRVERVEPWLWINFVKQTFFWNDAQTPLGSGALRGSLASLLAGKGITTLPMLVDALPLLVNDHAGSRPSSRKTADMLKMLGDEHAEGAGHAGREPALSNPNPMATSGSSSGPAGRHSCIHFLRG